MKRLIVTFLVMALLVVSAQAGQMFPDVTMTGKLTDEQKTYLGVSSDTFKISDIKAQYLFIEAFSMYCPVCQRDAPHVNEVYAAVMAADPGGTVKFLGIGLGNTPFEIAFYKKKYAVPFPLVWDEDYTIHKAIGEVGTPTFYIVRLADGSRETLYMREGEAENADALLKAIKDATGLK